MFDAALETFDPQGFWELEHDAIGPFRWSRSRFTIPVPDPDCRFAVLTLASPLRGNSVSAGGVREPMTQGWQALALALTGGPEMDIEVEHLFAAPDDARQLGLMVREVTFHNDAALHERLRQRRLNQLHNDSEFHAGAETLQSIPPQLRVTVSKRCNIANESPCVYCSWDWAKRLEQGSPDFTVDFLRRLGPFIDLASTVNDCSYGEPPLEPDFAEMVELATDGGRLFEFTSNGQTLSARKARALLGRNAIVHVSIDAASAASYQRYRDHRFELVISNLRALCAAKGGVGALPCVSVSFIVMHSNLNEISSFIDLMVDVGVDRVAFRTLFLEDRLDVRRLEHYGWTFDYDAECLDFDELQDVAARCKALGQAAGLATIVEWDEFNRNSSGTEPGDPLCAEPWRTAYVLDRGLMPCCYGRDPIVPWSEIDQASPASGLRTAINAEPFRALRRDLAAGRLGSYCLGTQGCPIVKARTHGPAPAAGT